MVSIRQGAFDADELERRKHIEFASVEEYDVTFHSNAHLATRAVKGL